MRLAPLRGSWGEGKGSHVPRGNWGTTGRAEDQKGAWPGFPAHLGPQEPAEVPSLILCPPRPPPAVQVLREWEGGKEEQK